MSEKTKGAEKPKDKFKMLEEAQSESPNGVGRIELSSGVVLKASPVSPMLLLRLTSRFEEPSVPLVHDPTLGHDMLNPDDPDYKKAMRNYETKATQLVVDGLVMYGTKVESVPKGFGSPKDNDWVEMLRAVGEETDPDNKFWRYLTWIETQAIKSTDDMQSIVEEVGRLSGVAEKDVDAAVDNFRGDEKGSKDTDGGS